MMVGPGMYTQQHVDCPSCEGSGSTIKEKDKCKKCKGQKVVDDVKVLEIFVDRGMHDGEVIVLQGQADETPGGEAGDVMISLRQKVHPIFERRGADLRADLNISLAEALCGFSRTVLKHLDGRLLKYTSPMGKVLRPAEVILVKGEGMPLGRRRDGFGDLYLVVHVEFPRDHFLSERADYTRLTTLLPQIQNKIEHDSDAGEDELVGEPGSLLTFGGDEAEGPEGDWDDEDEAEGEPGMQCNQQ